MAKTILWKYAYFVYFVFVRQYLSYKNKNKEDYGKNNRGGHT